MLKHVGHYNDFPLTSTPFHNLIIQTKEGESLSWMLIPILQLGINLVNYSYLITRFLSSLMD